MPVFYRWLCSSGRIAAGYPLEAIEDCQRDEIACLIAAPGRYALRVGDDSMIDSGIHRDDIVIVQSGQRVSRGDIIVALIDDEPLALHRIDEISHRSIRMRSDLPAGPGRELSVARVDIQGKIIGQLRYHPQ